MNILDYETIFDYRGQSYNSACDEFPQARHYERQALLDLLTLSPEDKVIDAPAGGGYLADGIRETFGRDINITCIEPAANFGQRIHPEFTVINCPINDIKLEDKSIDVIASLAGLHHIEDRLEVFQEWSRLLKKGGQLAVADVAAGSGPDEFLNGFVDQHTPQGHDGLFFSESEFSDLFSACDIETTSDRIVSVPWLFDREADLANFCKKLFYLPEVAAEEVLDCLRSVVGIKRYDEKIGIEWELRYAHGIKKA